MIILWIVLAIVALFMTTCGIGMVIAFRAPSHVLCAQCSPIGIEVAQRRPEPGEACQICGAEPSRVAY